MDYLNQIFDNFTESFSQNISGFIGPLLALILAGLSLVLLNV